MNHKKQLPPDSSKVWIRYIGLGTQWMAAIGVSLWLGIKLDQWLNLSTPLLVWALPLLVITFSIFKLIKDTNKNSDGKQDN
jgi:Mn2+/Fe2+ NRAMP family transporter